MGWLAFLFVIVHFSLICVYALPSAFSNPKLKAIATPYVTPIFTQTWGMFAPCPTVNSTIEIKFFFENDSTGWVNPIAEAERQHAFYRATYHGELVLSAANLYYWFSLDMDEMGMTIGDEFPAGRMDEFYGGNSYFKIRNFIRGNGWYLYNSEVVSALIQFKLEDVITGEKGILTLPKIYIK